MNLKQIREQVTTLKVLPVIKINELKHTLPLAKALIDGGLPAAEITFRSDCAQEAIKLIKSNYPDMLVAAGTIVNKEQAKAAIMAGADFLISPGIDRELVKYCVDHNYIIIPGVTSASEAQLALNLQLEVVKFFPAETSGGYKAINALSAPFPQLEFMPTGGINENNINEYLKQPKIIACGGSWMVKEELIVNEKFDEITKLVREAITRVNQ